MMDAANHAYGKITAALPIPRPDRGTSNGTALCSAASDLQNSRLRYTPASEFHRPDCR